MRLFSLVCELEGGEPGGDGVRGLKGVVGRRDGDDVRGRRGAGLRVQANSTSRASAAPAARECIGIVGILGKLVAQEF
jgi:hypothetical protein